MSYIYGVHDNSFLLKDAKVIPTKIYPCIAKLQVADVIVLSTKVCKNMFKNGDS